MVETHRERLMRYSESALNYALASRNTHTKLIFLQLSVEYLEMAEKAMNEENQMDTTHPATRDSGERI